MMAGLRPMGMIAALTLTMCSGDGERSGAGGSGAGSGGGTIGGNGGAGSGGSAGASSGGATTGGASGESSGGSSGGGGTAGSAGKPATKFVAPNGSGTACTSENPCTPRTALEAAAAGDVIEYAGNTLTSPTVYTGRDSMLIVPVDKQGTEAEPIVIRCATRGGCLLDGESTHSTILLLVGTAYIEIDGFFVQNSGVTTIGNNSAAHLVGVVGSSSRPDDTHHITFRNIVGWDSTLSPSNGSGFLVTYAHHILAEDTAFWGNARKTYALGASKADSVTVRRAFGIWNCKGNPPSGPRMTFSIAYNSTDAIMEDLIGMYDFEGSSPEECVQQGQGSSGTGNAYSYGIFSEDHNENVPGMCVNSDFFGGIAVIKSNHADYVAPGILYWEQTIDCIGAKDMLLYTEQPSIRAGVRINGNTAAATCTKCDYRLRNFSIIGVNSPTTGKVLDIPGPSNRPVQQANVQIYASVSAMNGDSANPFQATAGAGARQCFRHQDGVLTSVKKWPWPNEDMIAAGMDLDKTIDKAKYLGKSGTVTGAIEEVFGPIPSECKAQD